MAPIFFHTVALFASLLSLAYCMPTVVPRWNYPLTIEQLQKREPLDGLPPNTPYKLVYTALGIGHQNYTCNGTAYVQNVPGSGASALLYDTTQFLEYHPNSIDSLSSQCNYQHCEYPQILYNLLGDHYFSAISQPTFNLTRAHPPRVLSGVKMGDEPAPTDPTVNIDWLYLTANPANTITHGLKAVYRIDTYHGKAPSTCATAGQTLSLPYTAQYWFFD